MNDNLLCIPHSPAGQPGAFNVLVSGYVSSEVTDFTRFHKPILCSACCDSIIHIWGTPSIRNPYPICAVCRLPLHHLESHPGSRNMKSHANNQLA